MSRVTKVKRSIKAIEVAGSLPVDLDTAATALAQASGILDMLTARARTPNWMGATPAR